jgi:adenine phosphoribosyltransferase
MLYAAPMTTDDKLSFIAERIRNVPDFPKPGIMFKDITPLLADPVGLDYSLSLLADAARALQPTLIVGVESRGFIFGVPLADRLRLGFAPVRKPGKLPYRCVRDEYELEYGKGVLELHEDAVAGHNVLIVDDLLATGGTAECAARLCERQGARVVGFAFVIELAFLAGRKKLGSRPIHSLLTY